MDNPRPEPPPEELELARFRLALLDAIAPKCKWELVAPGWEAEQARERWHRIMKVQSDWETLYF